MFYNKKYPENKDKVLLSDIDREDRIEEGFNNVETEFRNVKETINEKFSDMIDYPIEQEFGNNQYTKWKSGRLTQVVRYNAELTSGNNNIRVPLPIEGVGVSNAIATVRTTDIAYNRVNVHRTLSEGDVVNVGIRAETDTSVQIIVFFEGRWK